MVDDTGIVVALSFQTGDVVHLTWSARSTTNVHVVIYILLASGDKGNGSRTVRETPKSVGLIARTKGFVQRDLTLGHWGKHLTACTRLHTSGFLRPQHRVLDEYVVR